METVAFPGTTNFELEDAVGVLRRQRYVMLFVFSIVVLLSVMLAMGLPAIYKAKATISIEEQEIPSQLVMSTVTTYADRQIKLITQRIMTPENVNQLVEKYSLFSNEYDLAEYSADDLLELFEDRFLIDPITADVVDSRTGRQMEAIVAFSVSYEDRNPKIAQQVANDMADLYLLENSKNRSSRAVGAADFLREQSKSVSAELQKIEAEVASFKEANEGALPELYQYNINALDKIDENLSDIGVRITELNKRQLEVSSELSQISPSAPVVMADGQTVLSDADRLKALLAEFRQKSAVYRDNHPDIRRLTREIENLENSLGIKSVGDLSVELEAERSRLAGLRQKYTEGHPEVVASERIVEQLEDAISKSASASTTSQIQPDNPSYILLDTQLKSIKSELQSLIERRDNLEKRRSRIDELIKQSPRVEKEYQSLMRNYDAQQQKFQEIRAKLRDAEVASNLEQESLGQKFTLIESAELPESPARPNRKAVVFVGIVLGGGIAFVIVLLRELLNSGIYGKRTLTKVMGVEPLVVVPYIDNHDDERARSQRHKMVFTGFLSISLVFVVYVHFYYKPLGEIGLGLMQKLGLL